MNDWVRQYDYGNCCAAWPIINMTSPTHHYFAGPSAANAAKLLFVFCAGCYCSAVAGKYHCYYVYSNISACLPACIKTHNRLAFKIKFGVYIVGKFEVEVVEPPPPPPPPHPAEAKSASQGPHHLRLATLNRHCHLHSRLQIGYTCFVSFQVFALLTRINSHLRGLR